MTDNSQLFHGPRLRCTLVSQSTEPDEALCLLSRNMEHGELRTHSHSHLQLLRSDRENTDLDDGARGWHVKQNTAAIRAVLGSTTSQEDADRGKQSTADNEASHNGALSFHPDAHCTLGQTVYHYHRQTSHLGSSCLFLWPAQGDTRYLYSVQPEEGERPRHRRSPHCGSMGVGVLTFTGLKFILAIVGNISVFVVDCDAMERIKIKIKVGWKTPAKTDVDTTSYKRKGTRRSRTRFTVAMVSRAELMPELANPV